jgi:hypothetical protein
MFLFTEDPEHSKQKGTEDFSYDVHFGLFIKKKKEARLP